MKNFLERIVTWFTRQNPKHLLYASVGLNVFLFAIVLAFGLRTPCSPFDVSGYVRESKRLNQEVNRTLKMVAAEKIKRDEAEKKANEAIELFNQLKKSYEKNKPIAPLRPDYSRINDSALSAKWAGHTR